MLHSPTLGAIGLGAMQSIQAPNLKQYAPPYQNLQTIDSTEVAIVGGRPTNGRKGLE